jgi:hypothetical protein
MKGIVAPLMKRFKKTHLTGLAPRRTNLEEALAGQGPSTARPVVRAARLSNVWMAYA